MKSFSVLLFAGRHDIPGRALCMARCFARHPNIKLHILSQKNWEAVRFSRYINSCHVIEGNSGKQWLDTIRQTVKHTNADVLLPVTSSEVRFVSVYRESLTALTAITPVPELKLFDKVINKWSLSDFLAEHDIPGPETFLYKDYRDFQRKLPGMSFPVLVKRTQAGGGRNIHRFDSSADLLKFINENQDISRQSIVQEFIPGHDIHCHILCCDGRILAYTASKSILQSTGKFGRPNGIKFIKSESVFEYLSNLAAVLGWNGMAHIDLRYDERDKQVKLIDFNPDWDDSILGVLAAGVNLPYLACLAALGISFPLPGYSLTRFVRGKAAVKHARDYTFAETSWKYALQDPLAELVRLIQRFSVNR